MKYLAPLCLIALIAACGSQSSSTAAYDPPPRDENPLLSDRVNAQRLQQDLKALGAVGAEFKSLPDRCINYWDVVARSKTEKISKKGETFIDEYTQRCADYAESLAAKLRQRGYDSVEAHDLHARAVWLKAFNRTQD